MSYLTGPNHVFEGSVCVVFTHTGTVQGFADSGVWGANSFGEGGNFIVDQGQLRFYGPYVGSQYIVNHYLPVPDKFSTGSFDMWIDTAPLTPVKDGNVVLSERAKNDRRWLVRQNGFTDLVPLAEKELIDVNAVRTNHDGSIAADFGWKWQPNDLGSIFQSGPPAERFVALHEATATLIPDGDGWTVLRITAR